MNLLYVWYVIMDWVGMATSFYGFVGILGLRSFENKKQRSALLAIGLLVLAAPLEIYTELILGQKFLSHLFCWGAWCIVLAVLFDGNIRKKAAAAFAMAGIALLLEGICTVGFMDWIPDYLEAKTVSLVPGLQEKTTMTLAYLLVVDLIRFVIHRKRNKRPLAEDLGNLFTFALAPLLACLILLHASDERVWEPDACFHILMLALVVTFILNLYWTEWMGRIMPRQKMLEHKKELEWENKLEQLHQQEAMKKRRRLMEYSDTYKKELKEIQTLLEAKQNLAAEEKLDEITAYLDSTREYCYCGIPAVDACISLKQKEADEAGINLNVDLKLPRELDVSPMLLCSIFSNLLDNAIRAVKEQELPGESRFIRLTGHRKGNYVVIQTQNPATPGPFKIRKGHGYGMGILQKIAELNDGRFWTNFDEKTGLFHACISLPISKIFGGVKLLWP